MERLKIIIINTRRKIQRLRCLSIWRSSWKNQSKIGVPEIESWINTVGKCTQRYKRRKFPKMKAICYLKWCIIFQEKLMQNNQYCSKYWNVIITKNTFKPLKKLSNTPTYKVVEKKSGLRFLFIKKNIYINCLVCFPGTV